MASIIENVLRTLPPLLTSGNANADNLDCFWAMYIPASSNPAIRGTVPDTGSDWTIVNLSLGGGDGIQFAVEPSVMPNNYLYVRTMQGSDWGNWQQIATSEAAVCTLKYLQLFNGLGLPTYGSNIFEFVAGGSDTVNFTNAPVILNSTGFGIKNPSLSGTYQNQITMAFDVKEGVINVKGGFQVNGVPVGGGSVPDVLELDHQASEPAAPAAGTTKVFSRKWFANTVSGSGKPHLWMKESSGPAYALQPHNAGPLVRYIQPGTAGAAATIFTGVGVGFTASATAYTQVAISTGSLKNRMRWGRLASATTTGSVAYVRANYLEVSREGGFFAVFRVSLETLQSGNRFFCGLAATVGNPTNIDPLTTASPARIGFGFNANSGNWRAIYSDGSVVIADELSWDAGASVLAFNNTDVFEFVIFCAPGSSTIYYTATNMATGVTVDGTFTTRIPANTTGLGFQAWMTNNATAAAVAFNLNRIYLESPY